MYYLIGCFVCFVFGPQFGLGPPRAPPLDLPLIVMLENLFLYRWANMEGVTRRVCVSDVYRRQVQET